MAPIIAHAPRRAARHAILVLAAGGSRRLGCAKQLVRVHGRPLVALAVDRALATRPRAVVVVVGAHASRVRAALRGLPLHVVHNRHWRTGMAGSLRSGLQAVPAGVATLLVTSVDQWAIGAADLRSLVRACAGRRVAAAAYAHTLGIPAAFPRAAWSRLRGVRGDRGARALLREACVVPVPMPAAEPDLDTPADLARLRAAYARAAGSPRVAR